MLEYKGYVAVMKVEVEDGVIAGRTIGMRDGVTFQGSTVPETVQAFHDSIDDYLQWCKERGKEPDKPFSGKLVLRVSSELHKRLAVEAADSDRSLNTLINDLIVSGLDRGVQSNEAGQQKTTAGAAARPAPVKSKKVAR